MDEFYAHGKRRCIKCKVEIYTAPSKELGAHQPDSHISYGGCDLGHAYCFSCSRDFKRRDSYPICHCGKILGSYFGLKHPLDEEKAIYLNQDGVMHRSGPEMKTLFRHDPCVLAERLAKAGRTRLEDPEIEQLYWAALIDCTELVDKANEPCFYSAMLARSQFHKAGLLFDLHPDHLQWLYDYVQLRAERELEAMNLPPDETEETRTHPLLLPEKVLERRGLLAEAAVLYGLTHDLFLPEQGNYMNFGIGFLRFKFARTWHLLNQAADETPRKISVAEGALEMLDQIHPEDGIPEENLVFIRFKVAEWLGLRCGDVGDWDAAFHAYEKAADLADTFDEKVQNRVRAAESLARMGKKQEAFRLVRSIKNRLPEIVDPDVRRNWEHSYSMFIHELGGSLFSAEHDFENDVIAQAMETFKRMLSEDAEPGEEMISRFISELRSFRGEFSQTDPDFSFKISTAILRLVNPMKNPDLWDSLSKEARRAARQLDDEKLLLDFDLIQAKGLFFLEKVKQSAALYKTLWPKAVEILEAEALIDAAGYYLLALSRNRDPSDAETVLELSGKILTTIFSLMAGQPGALARRRFRESQQRPIEMALNALVSFAHISGVESDRGQHFLATACDLVLRTRNMEFPPPIMEFKRGSSMDKSILLQYLELERDFHKALYKSWVERDASINRWLDCLKKLINFEMSYIGQANHCPERSLRLPKQGVVLVFFKSRESFDDKRYFVIEYNEDRYTAYGVIDGESMDRSLKSWAQGMTNARTPVWPDTALSKIISDLFPTLSRPETPPRSLFGSRNSDIGNERLDAPTLYLFPDGILSEIPLESLPSPNNPSVELGARWNVQQCLTFNFPEHKSKSVDFSGGWLGLASSGPGELNLEKLEGAEAEVDRIQRLVRKSGFAARVIPEPEAHLKTLEAFLLDRRPTVLHLAVHGVADAEHPEACALLLSGHADSVDHSLLSFRKIQRLDLEGVELVVLSACSSAVGRAGRSQALKSLAWAFLGAGVKSVIASRWKVDDDFTAAFMELLYRHMLNGASPGEAMRLTREKAHSKARTPVPGDARPRSTYRDLTLVVNEPFSESNTETAAWGLWM